MSNKYEGFDALHQYFKNLDKQDILLKNHNTPCLNMSWIFTESLDRYVIQKTIANIMKKNNPNYEEKSEFKNHRPEDIFNIEVLCYLDDNFYLQFKGADDWTKLRITDEISSQYKSKIPTITLETFEKEIQKTLKDSLVQGFLSNANLTSTQFQQIVQFLDSQHLSTRNLSQVEQSGINLALNDAFKNLTKYYQYLIDQKKIHAKHTCTIMQREDTLTTPRQHRGEISTDRKFPVMPFNLRAGFLQNHNPETIVEVSEQTKNNEIIPNAYTTYIFKHALSQIQKQQNGYLFISEPLDGTRETRLFFLSQQEFNDFSIQPNEDKYSTIVKHYLEMSQKEFYGPGKAKLTHTDSQSYSDRLNFFIQGTKAPSLSNLKDYLPRLQNLYSDESLSLPYYKPRSTYTPSQIASMGINSKGTIDRTAQNALIQADPNKSHN